MVIQGYSVIAYFKWLVRNQENVMVKTDKSYNNTNSNLNSGTAFDAFTVYNGGNVDVFGGSCFYNWW